MALTRYLQKRALPLPVAVTGPPADDSAVAGYVTPSFARGALLFRGADDKHYRLSWGEKEPDDPDADRRRALPPGKYELTGYRIIATDDADTEWHISATALSMRELEIETDKSQAVKIDPTVYITKKPAPKGMGVAVLGDGGAGLSIYHGDSRIPIAGRLVNSDGREVASGAMRYG